MNELISQVNLSGGENLREIIANIDNLPEEIKVAAFEVLKLMNSQVRDAIAYVEGKIIHGMIADDTKKIVFRGNDGISKEVTLKPKTPKCVKKDIDAAKLYENSGFDSSDIGDMIYKASWAKAKKARDYSGEKKLIIDELFKSEGFTLEIKEIAL